MTPAIAATLAAGAALLPAGVALKVADDRAAHDRPMRLDVSLVVEAIRAALRGDA